MKQAAITSSSKPLPALGVAVLSRAANTSPATAASTPMLTKVQNDSQLRLDARQPRRLFVATQRVDAPADGRAGGDEVVEQHQARS